MTTPMRPAPKTRYAIRPGSVTAAQSAPQRATGAIKTYGLLVDNKFCTGCYSCEVSCKNEHDLPLGQWGIKVMELGPWKLPDGKKWEYRYIPQLTSLCDLCAERVSAGKDPACVHHCLADALTFGTLDELAVKMSEMGQMASILIP